MGDRDREPQERTRFRHKRRPPQRQPRPSVLSRVRVTLRRPRPTADLIRRDPNFDRDPIWLMGSGLVPPSIEPRGIHNER